MTFTVSASASRISSSVMVIVFGTPSIRCRPLISIVSRSSSGKAEPISHLDLLGGPLADEQVVRLLDVLDDRLVHLVARHPHRLAVDDARERDDGDVGGAAADVDDHVAGRLGDRHAGADRRRHRLLDQVHLAGLGAVGAVLDGALLHLRDLRRHADDDARADPHVAVVGLLDEVGEHLLGDFEVSDDAVLHRLDGHDVAGRAAQHLLGLLAHRLDPAVDLVDGHDRGLVDDDPLPARVDAGVGRAEIDGEVAGEEREDRTQAQRTLQSQRGRQRGRRHLDSILAAALDAVHRRVGGGQQLFRRAERRPTGLPRPPTRSAGS